MCISYKFSHFLSNFFQVLKRAALGILILIFPCAANQCLSRLFPFIGFILCDISSQNPIGITIIITTPTLKIQNWILRQNIGLHY